VSSLRLKLSGLGDVDKNSIYSMLRLSADLLTEDWTIVDEGPADLVIFSFDSEAGQHAWQQRQLSLTALLTHHGNVTEPVDIVLRKPLRKSNFSDALNLVEEKIRLKHAAATTADTHATPNKKKADWSKKLLDTLNFRKKPAAHLPTLDLEQAVAVSEQTDSIKDPALLKAWVNQLPRDASQRTATLLKNLTPLCGLNLKPLLLLDLLEVYRGAIHDLLFTRDISAVKRDLNVTTESQRAIQGLSELFCKLAIGYQQIAHYYYERGETPDRNALLLLSLNRSAEQLALQILHAFQYYRRAPMGAWQRLHQVYLYQEQAETLQQLPVIKQPYQSRCFFDIYAQITLTALADPYSLARFDVIKLFSLMTKFTDKIETGLLSEKQINTTSNFLLTGHFCIDPTHDQLPQPMVKTEISIRQLPTTRLLNTQPALLFVENLFKGGKSQPQASQDTELRLLKKIIPQLNTTHERRFHRLRSGKHRNVQIAHGIKAIHQNLTDTLIHAQPWQMANQSSGGIMARRNTDGCYHLNIGDFVGIFESGLAIKLATVRWLHIELDGETTIGLELIDGKPVPVFCTPDGEAAQHPVLILPADKPGGASALITEKGLYSPKRKLRVKGDGEPYLIEASGMIDSTLDYEQFNFTIKSGS
jgi:hypothetical protein